MNFLIEIVAFVVAIGVLVVVHEFGHYSVARLCGVKVLRFSVGFGKPLVKWVSKRTGTEWTIAALPPSGSAAIVHSVPVRLLTHFTSGLPNPTEIRRTFTPHNRATL